jgi:CRP-like cAMP-binding protein
MITSLLILSIGLLPILTNATYSTSTVVALTDSELNELLQIVFNQLAGSTLIPMTLLESLGLNTASVISLLQSLGYTLFW